MSFNLGQTRFYGNWLLRTGDIHDPDDASSSFIIRGSQGQDGMYPVRSQDPPTVLMVTGAEWEVQISRRYGLMIWTQALFQRTTTFEVADGVHVELDSRAPHSGGAPGTLPGMQLLCTLDDPTTNTPDPGDPFDFTVPELPNPQGRGQARA